MPLVHCTYSVAAPQTPHRDIAVVAVADAQCPHVRRQQPDVVRFAVRVFGVPERGAGGGQLRGDVERAVGGGRGGCSRSYVGRAVALSGWGGPATG